MYGPFVGMEMSFGEWELRNGNVTVPEFSPFNSLRPREPICAHYGRPV